MSIDEHAPLPPSSAGMWVHCHGWLAMNKDVVTTDTPDTLEGSASHWVGETLTRYAMDPDSPVLTSQSFLDKPAPNGIIIDEEMYDSAYEYYMTLMKTANDHGVLRSLLVERRVEMPEIHENVWGTMDCGVLIAAISTLIIDDYKYGHDGISAVECWQLICYASGMISLCNLPPEHKVVLRITQPRAFNDGLDTVRTWETTVGDLRNYINQLNYAAHMQYQDNAQVTSGPHCKNCNARHKCPAAGKSASSSVEYAFSPVPVNLDPAGVGYELNILTAAEDMIDLRKKALLVQGLNMAMMGAQIPDWVAERKFGNNSWNGKPEEIIFAVQLMTGIDISKPVEPLPVGKTIKLLKKNKVDDAVISSYYSKKPKEMALVPFKAINLKGD